MSATKEFLEHRAAAEAAEAPLCAKQAALAAETANSNDTSPDAVMARHETRRRLNRELAAQRYARFTS